MRRHFGSRAMLCCVNGAITLPSVHPRTEDHVQWEESPMLTTLVVVLLLFAAYLLLRYHE